MVQFFHSNEYLWVNFLVTRNVAIDFSIFTISLIGLLLLFFDFQKRPTTVEAVCLGVLWMFNDSTIAHTAFEWMLSVGWQNCGTMWKSFWFSSRLNYSENVNNREYLRKFNFHFMFQYLFICSIYHREFFYINLWR